MSFRDLQIDIGYSGRGDVILSNLVLPLLSESVQYDRVSSFFSTQSLVAISEGLNHLWQRHGRMRLVLGIHDIPADLAESVRRSEDPSAEVIVLIRQRIVDGLATIQDEMIADRLSTMAWMIKDGFLAIKVAAPKSLEAAPPGIFHPKQFIFRDENGDIVAAVGSPNETRPGLGRNIERLSVYKSWEVKQYTDSEILFFEQYWDDDHEDLNVRDLDPSFADEILAAFPEAAERTKRVSTIRKHTLRQIFDLATQMPPLAMVSGGHTALFPHQELVFLEALSRWPVRVMLADEVGLGKTFEAGAVIKYMLNYSVVERVLVLAPKAVVTQWQAELNEHFGLDAWIYDSSKRSYISSGGEARILSPGEPVIGSRTPNICIISAQLARGTSRGGDLFAGSEVLPDLLVVDEAHAARVKPDLGGGEHPTLMWRMLDELVKKIPHIIFATATPMQIHWREYHALLTLLGLPTAWKKPENYERGLDLVVNASQPDLPGAGLAVRLISESLRNYKPDGLLLTEDEKRLADELSGDRLDLVDSSIALIGRWSTARSLLIKCHPARFLTIRNTRTALEQIGYRFPQRNMPDSTLQVPDDILVFYDNVERYLSDAYFSVEKALYPNRRFNVGFVTCAYQQRLASSLTACRLSLSRRRERVMRIESQAAGAVEALELGIEELTESDVFNDDSVFELSGPSVDRFDLQQAAVAARIERAFIDDLISSLNRILGGQPDPKMVRTNELIRLHTNAGDSVLVFSRYTDTLDAVIDSFRGSNTDSLIPYAIYTGQTAEIDFGTGSRRSTRKEIKEALFQGAVRIVFCSDAASEGLNLQAARVIINVDVPWNPARLEQRIGRIARLGQTAETVDIYNLWYPESIEAKMYTRLMQRRDLFELAVGEFPDVIGRAIRDELATNFGAGTSNRDPITELNNLKNNIQVRALRQLWDRDVPTRTLTGKFRQELASLAVAAAEAAGAVVSTTDNDNYQISKDGTAISFSLSPGKDNVMDLQSQALKWLTSRTITLGPSLGIMTNDSGPAFFADHGAPVDPETLPGLVNSIVSPSLDRSVSETRLLEPANGLVLSNWLPNVNKLTIPVSVETEITSPPGFETESLMIQGLIQE